MRVLTAAQMQAVDRRAIDELGIPGMVLMENASVGVADALGERFPEARSVTIFCGPGNNGGDGLALARILDARGYGVSTFLVLSSTLPTGDAGNQLAILERAGRPVTVLKSEDSPSAAVDQAARGDLVVDALFGTGLGRALEGHFAELTRQLNRLEVPILAVDLPSGLNGSTGQIPGDHLRADLTVTFAAPKIAHAMAPACSAVGEVAVVDLGIPPELVEEADGNLFLSTDSAVRSMLFQVDPASHKGTFGHVLLAGGSRGKSGAMVLAARAAVRGGAGLVTVAVPSSVVPIVEAGSIESMTIGLPESAEGVVIAAGEEPLIDACAGKAALGLGPGLGTDAGARALVDRCLRGLEIPIVLDADGLNVAAGDWHRLKNRGGPTVLTPHPGEAARWLEISAEDVQADRISAVRELTNRSGAVVVLKGFRTLIAEPDGDIWINPTGNSAMATGGSGDVLTGLLTALLGRGYDAFSAARIAVYVHGSAGDRTAAATGRAGLAAGDLITGITEIWSRWDDDDA